MLTRQQRPKSQATASASLAENATGVSKTVADREAIKRWRAGRIVTQDGRLVSIRPMCFAYKASRLRVWWDSRRRKKRAVQCEIFYHQSRSNPSFLVIGYISSHPQASLASAYVALLALDQVARLKRSDAIVAEITNPRISDRLVKRWGWQQHCLAWRGRHVIKRFYGNHPTIPEAWRARLAGFFAE